MKKTKTRKIAITALSLALVLIASLCLIMAPTNKINVDKVNALNYDTNSNYTNYSIRIEQFRAPANDNYMHTYENMAVVNSGRYGRTYTIKLKNQGNEIQNKIAYVHGDINSGNNNNGYYYGTYRNGEFTFLLDSKKVERVCYDGTNYYMTYVVDTINKVNPTYITFNFSSKFNYNDSDFIYIVTDNVTQQEITNTTQGVATIISKTTSETPIYEIPQSELYLKEMYENGITDGYTGGYDVGYVQGQNNGYNTGYNEGYNAGATDTNNQSYMNGVNDGLEQAKEIVSEDSESYRAGYVKGSYDVNLELTEVSGNIIGSFGDLVMKLLNFEVAGISMWMILAVIGGIIIIGIVIKMAI